VPMILPPPSRFLRLRGVALTRAVDLLVELRGQGRACWTCPRLLAAGAVCPEHGAMPKRRRRAA